MFLNKRRSVISLSVILLLYKHLRVFLKHNSMLFSLQFSLSLSLNDLKGVYITCVVSQREYISSYAYD